MPGVIAIDDQFTGLASATTISGRVPTVCDSGASYAVDPATSAATGGGVDDVKFSGSGVGVKIRSLLISGAVQVVMDDKGGNEDFGLFTRDTFSTPYPRQGYVARFKTRVSGGTNGTFTIYSVTNYNANAPFIATNVAWAYSATGINTISLESVANSHRVIINNVVAYTFTDSLYPAVTNANKFGVTYHTAAVPSVMRMDRLSVLDSVVITEPTSYVIVTVA